MNQVSDKQSSEDILVSECAALAGDVAGGVQWGCDGVCLPHL